MLCACAAPGNVQPGFGHDDASAVARVLRRPDYPLGSSPAAGVISHVVFIVQENRSFNNFFLGFPGAFTQNYGYDTNGNQIPLHAQDLSTNWDIDHSATAFFAAYNDGAINGWNNEYACCYAPPNFAYAYVPESQIRPYWSMAKQYVLADNAFASNLDGSYIAHQYTIAAYANHEVNYPSGNWGCEGTGYDVIQTLTGKRTYGVMVPVCENFETLGDELDEAGISWRFYTAPWDGDGGLWSAYGAIDHIYNGPDWTKNVITPASQFISDVAAGNMPAVAWITPTFGDSDHAGLEATGGPKWVSSLVNTVGESKYWNSTIIFLLWDDWGGWFDPVAPVYEDYDGLGFRIPLVMIAPYAKRGSVTHVQYETSSVLKFVEDLFALAPLAASDRRAADPAADAAFDFTKPPRPFKKFDHGNLRVRPHNVTKPPVGGD